MWESVPRDWDDLSWAARPILTLLGRPYCRDVYAEFSDRSVGNNLDICVQDGKLLLPDPAAFFRDTVVTGSVSEVVAGICRDFEEVGTAMGSLEYEQSALHAWVRTMVKTFDTEVASNIAAKEQLVAYERFLVEKADGDPFSATAGVVGAVARRLIRLGETEVTGEAPSPCTLVEIGHHIATELQCPVFASSMWPLSMT